MNADIFEEFFEQMIDFILPNSGIVMDNSGYHLRQCEKIPFTTWQKPRIIQWHLEKQIPFQENMLKKELLSIIQLNKSRFKQYLIDEMAKKKCFYTQKQSSILDDGENQYFLPSSQNPF